MKNKLFSWKFFKPFVHVLDALFALFVVGPLVIVNWVSTWILFDLFIEPDNPIISAVISFAIGFVGQLFLLFYQDSITKRLKFKNLKLINLIISKFYALVFALTSISLWRGMWKFIDINSSNDIFESAVNILQNTLILALTKTLKNSIASPFIVTMDEPDSDFKITTYFQRVKADGSWKFLADCLTSLFITLVITFLWRDIWAIIDLYLFPEDLFSSAVASLLIGSALSLLCFTTERAVGFLCEDNKKYRIYVHDAFIFVCLIASISVWRGSWMMLELYIGYNKKLLFLLHGASWKLLMVLNCIESLSGRGMLIDAVENGNECVKLPIDYFKKRILKHNQEIILKNCVSTKL